MSLITILYVKVNKLVTCPKCGKKVDDEAIVCKHCGTTLKCEEWDAGEVLYYYGYVHKPIPAQNEDRGSGSSDARCKQV